MNSVVIVDENICIVELIVNALEKYNQVKVIGTANNGNIAEKLIKELKPDIVVIDIKMHSINAIEFLENVSKLEKDDIPIFIIISTPIEERIVIDKLIDLSVKKVIMKPFKMEELVNEILENKKRANKIINSLI